MDANTLNIVEEDECCAARLSKALLADANLRNPWYCPKCGTEWRPNLTMNTPRYWQPIVECAVIKL